MLFATARYGTNAFRGIWRTIDQAIRMLLLFLREKIAKRVHIIAEPLGQFLPDSANFGDDGIICGGFHGVSSSSGVQTIGGSYPFSRQIAFTIFRTTPFAM